MKRLHRAGLLDISELKVFVNFYEKDNNIRETKLKILNIISKYTKNMQIDFNRKNEYEYRAILDIWETAKKNKENEPILYFHTKGISKPSTAEVAWREYMEYFVIDKWNLCMSRLQTHDAVGVNIVANPFSKVSGNSSVKVKIDKGRQVISIVGPQLLFVPHYSGNFWWANSKYIATLPKPNKPKSNRLVDRMKYEIWIGMGDNFKGATLHQCKKAWYKEPVLESEYK